MNGSANTLWRLRWTLKPSAGQACVPVGREVRLDADTVEPREADERRTTGHLYRTEAPALARECRLDSAAGSSLASRVRGAGKYRITLGSAFSAANGARSDSRHCLSISRGVDSSPTEAIVATGPPVLTSPAAPATVAKRASAREPSAREKRASAGRFDGRGEAVPDAEEPIGADGAASASRLSDSAARRWCLSSDPVASERSVWPRLAFALPPLSTSLHRIAEPLASPARPLHHFYRYDPPRPPRDDWSWSEASTARRPTNSAAFGRRTSHRDRRSCPSRRCLPPRSCVMSAPETTAYAGERLSLRTSGGASLCLKRQCGQTAAWATKQVCRSDVEPNSSRHR